MVSSGADSASGDAVGAVDGIQGGPATSAGVGYDSDELPLFRSRAVGAAVPEDSDQEDVPLAQRRIRPGSPGSPHHSSESESESEPLPDSIDKNQAWSVDICYDIHNLLYDEPGYEGPWELSRVERKGKDSSITVTRRPRPIAMELCQGRHVDLKICFDVTTGDDVFDDRAAEDQGGHYFIMFDTYAGAMLIEIESIAKELPKRKDAAQWAQTAKFRRVYPASEAVNRTDSEMGNKHYLGKLSLQKFADMEVKGVPASVTYHVGDCIYTGDVRAIIGVVRWFSERYRGTNHPSLNSAKWPYPHADLAYSGLPFSEKASRRKAKSACDL